MLCPPEISPHRFIDNRHCLRNTRRTTTIIADPMQLSHTERIAIANANYGRDYGWHVLSECDEPLATLTDPQYAEMFWTSYLVTPLDGHIATQTKAFWYPDCHRIRNIRYPAFVVNTFGHFDPKTNRATIRFDYLNVEFNWTDFLRSPLWCLRSWLN